MVTTNGESWWNSPIEYYGRRDPLEVLDSEVERAEARIPFRERFYGGLRNIVNYYLGFVGLAIDRSI
jgi:hypothetical protein